MYAAETQGRTLTVMGVFAVLGMALSSAAQEAEPSPAPVPWQKIESWALTAPESSAGPKDQPKEPVKEPAKELAKESVKETPQDVSKDASKDAPKDVAKDTPKESTPTVSTWTPSRPGERRPEPPAYKAMHEQVLAVMSQRLKDTQNTNYKRQAEIYMTLEQYDKSLALLNQMQNEPKRWKEEVASGWISGNLWECALFCRTKPPAAWIQQQFDDWKTKEPTRIEAYIVREGYGAAYRERVMKAFHEKADYFTKEGATIAEKVKDLELKGDSSPAALVELRERGLVRRPGMPVMLLRVLIKLREWYPELPDTKSGETQMALVRHLGNGFSMFREGAREAESLMEKIPTCAEVTRGAALYYAAEYAYQHAEHLAPDPEDGWSLSDRNRPVHKEAREYWERARQLFLRLKKEYPKNGANEVSTSTGLSDVDSRLNYIARPERLGAAKP
jgi:hypothetical protein